MTDAIVFRVENAVAQAAAPKSLAEAGLTDRAHLQEWVLAHPAILGEAIGRAGLPGSERDSASARRRNAPVNTVIDMRHGGIEREEPTGDDGNGARGGDA